MMSEEKDRDEMNRVTIVGAGCNLALSGIKAAGGIMGGSTVLVADAVHSLTDLLSDGVTLVATNWDGEKQTENIRTVTVKSKP